MSTKRFEEALEEQKRFALDTFHDDHNEGDTAIYRFCQAIRIAHQAALEAKEVESRIDELERKYTLHVELMSSRDYKDGFSAALDQIDAADGIRITQLQSQLKAKEKTDL